jgi:hypothetical protein
LRMRGRASSATKSSWPICEPTERGGGGGSRRPSCSRGTHARKMRPTPT